MQNFSFENLLTSYRARGGWTQQEVVEELEVSLRTYQGWENGERLPPNKMLQRIVHFFELNDADADQLYRAAAQVAPEIHNLPFPRNPYFTGREKFLKRLAELMSETTAVAITQAISGLGGKGKTQLAIEYAYNCYPKVYRAILWVSADSYNSLLLGFIELAKKLNLPEKDEENQEVIILAVKRWFETHTRWLLILDNAEDIALVKTFIPVAPQGHILLTTRTQILGTFAQCIDIERMNLPEGTLFLLRRAKLLTLEDSLEHANSNDRIVAEQIVDILDGLPLALDQAGAYIEETGSSLLEYSALYKQKRLELLQRRGRLGEDHPESVVLTFLICFDKVKDRDPIAVDLLNVCTFLHPDAIPQVIFTKGALLLGPHLSSIASDLMRFGEAIAVLRAYSLIQVHQTDERQTRMFSIHRLVQAVREDLMDAQTRRLWIERTVSAVNTTFPEAEYALHQQCELLLPHALSCVKFIETTQLTSREAAYLLVKTGSYLRQRDRYREAEPLLQRALEIYGQKSSEGHLGRGICLNELAILYQVQGKDIEAEILYQQALAIFEHQPEADYSGLSSCLTNLAILYTWQGKYKGAEVLYQRALAIFEESPILDYRNTANCLSNLADLYRFQRKYEEAEKTLRKALAISERIFGKDHPGMAANLSSLADIYRNQRRYKEAEKLYQRALEIFSRQLGEDHSDTAACLEHLAILCCEQERYGEAESLLQKAITIFKQRLREDHPCIAICLKDLACVYARQGRYKEAEGLYQQALVIFEQLGADRPEAAECLVGLVNLYYYQKE